MSDVIVWVDLETTGLNPQLDPIIEVGLLLTDRSSMLRSLYYNSWVVKPESWPPAHPIHERVREMHDQNGLWAEVEQGLPIRTVEGLVCQLIHKHADIDQGQVILGGSGVAAFDRPVIRHQMPKLDAMLTYWSYDVGVVRRFLQLAGVGIPETTRPEQDEHRALPDIVAAVRQARAFLQGFSDLAFPLEAGR